MSTVYFDGAAMPVPDGFTAGPAAAAAVRYVPVWLARQRLEAASRWAAVAAALASDPAMLLKVATLQLGLDAADVQVRALLTACGANADAILAP